jgi:hypothetical protein
VKLESGCPRGEDPEVIVDGAFLRLFHRSSPKLLALLGLEWDI